jgi:hypothetical protein
MRTGQPQMKDVHATTPIVTGAMRKARDCNRE